MEQINEGIEVIQIIIAGSTVFAILFQLLKMQQDVSSKDKRIAIIKNILTYSILSIVLTELNDILKSYF